MGKILDASAYIFVDSRSLFDDLWREWLYTQLLDLAEGTPMEDMDYGDIFKCLPKEKQKELSDQRISFAKKTGIENLLVEKAEKPQELLKDSTLTEYIWQKECCMGKAGKKSQCLLDIFVKVRTVKALDRAVSRNSAYQDALKHQDKAFDRLDNAGLSKEQSAIVDKAISAANDCGVAYGAAAYRLGLQDGIRLVSEIKEFE